MVEKYFEIKALVFFCNSYTGSNRCVNLNNQSACDVDILENVQGTEAAHRVDDEAAGRKRTGTM